MALTDSKIKTLKPPENKNEQLYSDGNGLYFRVRCTGNKSWIFRYKKTRMGLGSYPSISLKKAREEVLRLKEIIAEGKDPKIERSIQKAMDNNLFSHVAQEWFALKSPEYSEVHRKQTKSRLDRFILPRFGSRPIHDIKTPECIAFLREFEVRGHLEQRDKTKSHLSQIFFHAVVSGICPNNPIAGISSVLKTSKHRHYDFVSNPDDISMLLNDIDKYHGNYVTVMALKFIPFVMLRPKNVIELLWNEVDFKNKQLYIKGNRMKTGYDHVVPLAKQTLLLLTDIQKYSGNSQYVFPSPKNFKAPLSDNTLRLALRGMKYVYKKDSDLQKKENEKPKQDPHGFRHLASTKLHEMMSDYNLHSDMIERQMAHKEQNAVKAAYNHAEYLKERKRMMQIWADYLDELKYGSNVLELSEKKA